ncbi:hypothetical protein ABTG54_21515, partial [Acinetobacter baumannii]
LNTILSTGLSCYSRFLELQKPRLCKLLRVLAFAGTLRKCQFLKRFQKVTGLLQLDGDPKPEDK